MPARLASPACLAQTAPQFRRLNDAVVQLLDDYAMVSFTPLDISDEESIEDLLLQIDMAIQVRASKRSCRLAGRLRAHGVQLMVDAVT